MVRHRTEPGYVGISPMPNANPCVRVEPRGLAGMGGGVKWGSVGNGFLVSPLERRGPARNDGKRGALSTKGPLFPLRCNGPLLSKGEEKVICVLCDIGGEFFFSPLERRGLRPGLDPWRGKRGHFGRRREPLVAVQRAPPPRRGEEANRILMCARPRASSQLCRTHR